MPSPIFRWLTLSALIGALFNAGCSSTSTCSRDEDTIEVKNGWVSTDRTAYRSTLTDDQELVYFPANRTIVFDLGLEGILTSYDIVLSFSPDGNSTTSPSAGNSSLIKSQSADRFVMKNDTCTAYYVLLLATSSTLPFEQLDAGAGGASSAAAQSGEAGAAATGNDGAAGTAP